ncbi:uncharacterized protein LOC117222845 isoform X1 [Megalopta genalis]|uniref:uncharacterized protein LOC117222845 isoform X1 n=1 Tax=Megalopta genalis TaxID=115081 RepID=UPI003FD46ABF
MEKKESLLDILLLDGCKYLHMTNEMYQRNRESFPDFQRMLKIINCLSRVQTLLKVCLAILKEVETADIEQLLASGEFNESYGEGIAIQNVLVDSIDSLINSHKNTIKNLELDLLQKLDYYGKQLMLQTKMRALLQNYCAKTATVLKQTTSIENRFKRNARLANRFREKCEKLKGILDNINERQIFFWGNHNPGMSS